MDSNWLMPADRKRVEGWNEGERPSGSALMALVDQDDPAFMSIVSVLHEMRSAGVELDEQTVTTAVAMGRHRHRGSWRRSEESNDLPIEVDESSIVYYVRRADLVKIGTTRRPYKRFTALLPDEILAWEPGAHDVERARHREFAAWRVGGSEYFRPNEPLAWHVEQLRGVHGEPDSEWPTLASVSAIRATRLKPLAPPAAPVLVTLGQGVDVLGIKRNTADVWVRRQLLAPAGANENGKPLYLLAHMNELAERSGIGRAA